MKPFLLSLILFMFSIQVYPQQRHSREANPVLSQVSNKTVVQSVYPEATQVEKVNEFWYKITNESHTLYGYAMNSSDHCQDVMGYNNTTPVMIITDTNFIIKKIALLSHYETRGYVRRMQQAGFFNSWNETPLKDAMKVEPDGWSGATLTAEAVRKNINFLITNGVKVMPKRIKKK